MELLKITITKEQLEKIPESELLFFIQLTHFANEIFCLQKFTNYSVSLNGSYQILQRAQNAQALLFVRLTAGKLWEAWKLLQSHHSDLQEYEAQLPERVQNDFKIVKSYFSAPNCIKTIRNQYAFHFSKESSEGIKNSISSFAGNEEFAMYFSEHHGNCFYDMADILINHSLLNTIDQENEKAMQKMLTEIVNVIQLFLRFVGECVLVFGKRHLCLVPQKVMISDPPAIDEIHVPFFVSAPKYRDAK